MRKPVYLCAVVLFAARLSSGEIIKAGDVLQISVTDHPEFSGTYTVSADGTIEYPILADQIVVNLSTSELMNECTFLLAKHIDNPLVLISVVEKPMISVTVLGKVGKPGPVQTYLGVSVQEVLMLAGGVLGDADLQKIKIIRKGASGDNAEYCDLKTFMRNGNPEDIPQVRPDDVIIVLSTAYTQKIKVIGAVNRPGFFSADEKMNVFEVIYMAGGPSQKADLSRVRRFFKHEDKTIEEVLDIQSFMDKGELDNIPVVEPGDVIIVYSKWFDWRTLLSIMNNVLLFIVTVQALGGAFK